MRTARMLLATAAATAALAIAAPGAHATGDDWNSVQESSYSKQQYQDGGHDSARGGIHAAGGALVAVRTDDWVPTVDPKQDPETYRNDNNNDNGGGRGNNNDGGGRGNNDGGGRGNNDNGGGRGNNDNGGGRGNNDNGGGRGNNNDGGGRGNNNDGGGGDRPSGGIHTGGGALASPGVSTGGLAVLGVAATAVYGWRRKKAA
ncbi:hypothetical protein [Streptomyces adustus]|uniref:hypothetical protein n=1 Tax=Streptomyces adustus TaxID=1609272 RepID=UPI00371CB93C